MLRWTVRLRGGGPAANRPISVAVRHYLYSFGSDPFPSGMNSIDVHIFNTVPLTWRKLTPVTRKRSHRHNVPSSRNGHSAVLVEDVIYVWGGSTFSRGYACFCNVLYALDVNTHVWFTPQVSGTVPKARYRHSACVSGKIMFIHGGRTKWTTNDIHKLDTSTMVWTLINATGAPLSASMHHSATIIGTTMVVFGGLQGKIRVFDTETDECMNTALPFPEGCWGHSVFTYRGELYIFGSFRKGDVNKGYVHHYDSVQKFNLESSSWKKVELKGQGVRSWTDGMSCCRMGERVILFGGDGARGDLYVLDLSPSLRTLCKSAVIRHGLDQLELPHDVRWELEALRSDRPLKYRISRPLKYLTYQ